MKALTILQPWASLMACGAKKIETRSWATKYRGPLAIHAAKHINTPKCAWEEPFKSELIKAGMMASVYSGKGFAFNLGNNGMVVAIAELVDCVKVVSTVNGSLGPIEVPVHKAELENGITVRENEFFFGNYEIGRYAWMFENVRRINPIPAKGKQRLWNWEAEK